MSYVSLLKTIPDFLSKPAGIAIIASVGIHGVIALMLPLMPMEARKTKEVKTPKTVGLVELNQADRQRLPQTNQAKTTLNPSLNLQPQAPLPEFATKPTPLPTPVSPLPSSTQVVLPPLPTSSGKLRINALPNNLRSNPVTQPTNNASFRIRPTDRFQTRSSLSAGIPKMSFGQERIALKSRTGNSNALPRQLSPSEINTQTNTRNKIQRNNLQPSGLPSLNSAELPSGLPNNPVRTARGTTSVPGLPSSNQASTNSPGEPGVANNSSNITQNQQFSAAASDLKPIDRLGGQASPLPNNKVKSPNKITTEPELIAKAKQTNPGIEMQAAPLQPTLDLPQGEKITNVKGGLVVDGEGRIDFFELLDKSVPSNVKLAVRNHFKNYFQKNPVKANGKPKYFSFNAVFEPGNVQKSSSDSQSLRKRLESIRDRRKLKSNPSSNSEASNNEKSSSQLPLNIQSVIRTDGSSVTPQSNQNSPSRVLSQPSRSVVINSQDDSDNDNQVSSSSQENQQSLIQRLRKVREERKATGSK